MIDSIVQDLRVAVRQLARHRAFSAIVLVTLALGIGATATFFSVLNAVAFRPLPFPDPDQFVSVQRARRAGDGTSRMPYVTFAELGRTTAAVSSPVAYAPRTVTLSGRGVAEQVPGADVSGDLFALLGVPLERGRSLRPADAGAPVAVISHHVWTRRFDSDPAVVGATLVIDGSAHTIVGVASAGFGFPSDARVWMPFAAGSQGPCLPPRAPVLARQPSGRSAPCRCETSYSGGSTGARRSYCWRRLPSSSWWRAPTWLGCFLRMSAGEGTRWRYGRRSGPRAVASSASS